ncbi:MAG: LysR family transcriptional regulator [Oscillospiraceae bacterium]|jgi:DNA-binding transcriptional LysR family regulator
MTITQIKYFLAVAEHLNFTAAAKSLFIAQPHLSKQIIALENELGFKLFERNNRSVSVTEAGSYLKERLQDIPDIVQTSVSDARKLAKPGSPALSIGILDGQELTGELMSLITRLTSPDNKFLINVERGGFQQLRSGLKSKHFDIIITLLFDVADDETLETYVVRGQSGAFAINRRNPLADIEELNLHMLEDENFVAISPDESPGGYASFLAQCKALGFAPKNIKLAPTLESMLVNVEMGVGVIFIDRNTRLEKNPDIRIVDLPAGPSSSVVAVMRRKNNNPFVRKVLQNLYDKRGNGNGD